ncbi:MAG: hypothetical protein ACOZF2_13955 [Thermodesulfobacteriota bacterium]
MVWREKPGTPLFILGGGTISAAPRQLFGTVILWTDPDHPGIREAAEQLGYGGGTSMSFLGLENIFLPIEGMPVIQDLIDIQSRFNEANAAQLAILQQIACK